MESFKDENGKIWEVGLTIGKAKRIKARHKIDILADNASVVASRFAMDPTLRMDALYVMLENGAIEQDAFDDLLTPPVFQEADKAFWAEFRNFMICLDPKRIEVIDRLVAKEMEAGRQALEVVLEVANSQQTADLQAKLLEDAKTKAYEMMSGLTSTELQEVSESIPPRSPSEN